VCPAIPTGRARGWWALIVDGEIVFYCPRCAGREFGERFGLPPAITTMKQPWLTMGSVSVNHQASRVVRVERVVADVLDVTRESFSAHVARQSLASDPRGTWIWIQVIGTAGDHPASHAIGAGDEKWPQIDDVVVDADPWCNAHLGPAI